MRSPSRPVAGILWMVLTCLLFVAMTAIVKHVGSDVPAAEAAFLRFALGLPFAVAVWVPPTGPQLGWFLGTAVFATAAHYTMTLAFAAAPISATQPATFVQLVWAVAMGALLFEEAVDFWVVAGGAIIMTAVLAATLREAAARRDSLPG